MAQIYNKMGIPEIKVSVRDIPVDDLQWDQCDTSAKLESDKNEVLYIRVNPNGTERIYLRIPLDRGDKDKSDRDPLATAESWNHQLCDLDTFPKTEEIDCDRSASDDAYFSIKIHKETKEAFVLKLMVKTVKTAGYDAVCPVEYMPEDEDEMEKMPGGIRIKIVEAPKKQPVIKKFRLSRGIVLNNETLDVEWEVEDAETVTLKTNTYVESVKLSDNKKGQGITSKTYYTLRAKNGEFEVSQTLTANYHDVTGAYTANLFADSETEKNRLMNLFTAYDKLYALVKSTDGSDVLMYETGDGVNWNKSGDWSFNKNAGNKKVPLGFAGSSSVFYDDKIYLIGGSRFDTDFKSNETYFYDFKYPEKGWQKGATGSFSKRMGHAVVSYKGGDAESKGAIWLLGGFGAQDTLNDIHIFNGTSWEKSSVEMHHKLCMHDATVADHTIQVFGGFGRVPGEPDQCIADAVFYDLKAGKEWKNFDWFTGKNVSKEPSKLIIDKPLLSCVFSEVQKSKFIFTMISSEGKVVQGVYEISSYQQPLVEKRIANDLMLPGPFAVTQAVSFNRMTWFCSVSDDGEFKSNALTYFVYLNSGI